MDKLQMQTSNMADENFKKLVEIFPNIVTETIDENGNVVRAINKELLEQEISTKVVDGPKERYEFIWPEKKQSIIAANAPTTNTLRPSVEDSVNFDTTKNLYIEGDNLEVLKILQETYLGKVKMIYIDPPYNTGSDFVYEDDFAEDMSEYKDRNGQFDEEGNRLFVNTERNGRFHTDWLNMIYPRLIMARNFLSDDGVIFISIDDNEQVNLKKICDEVFGERNFIAQIIIDQTPKNDPLLIATSHEYMLCYVKNILKAKEIQWGALHPLNTELNDLVKGLDKDEAEKALAKYYEDNKLKNDNISNYKFYDEGGIYRIGPLDDPQGNGPRDDRINLKTGGILKVPEGGWRSSVETWNEWVENNLIEFPDNDDVLASKKTYLSIDKYEVARSVIKLQGRKATSDLEKLFDGKKVFNNPKSVDIIKDHIENLNDKNAVVMDFFSGFRVIIVIEANSYVNIRSSRLLPKFKTQKINSWCAA